MDKKTKMILGVVVLAGGGYLLWKYNKKKADCEDKMAEAAKTVRAADMVKWKNDYMASCMKG